MAIPVIEFQNLGYKIRLPYFHKKDMMNYKFLTTETNSKALYIYRCFLTQPHQ